MNSAMRRLRSIAILGGCVLYLCTQAFVIVRGHFVDSKHFAFWMFPESTRFVAQLFLETKTGRQLPTNRGRWGIGRPPNQVRFDWGHFVNDYRLDFINRKTRSKGTWLDNEQYFQEALNYVIDRIPEDTLTNRLVLRIRVEKAGEAPKDIVLKSKPRFTQQDAL